MDTLLSNATAGKAPKCHIMCLDMIKDLEILPIYRRPKARKVDIYTLFNLRPNMIFVSALKSEKGL